MLRNTLIAFGLLAAGVLLLAADSSYNTKVYIAQGGDSLVVTSGGTATIEGTFTSTTALQSTADAGSETGTNVSVVEYGDGVIHKSVFTFSSATITLANGGVNNHLDFYTFPAGAIKILAASVDIAVTNTANFNASDNDHFYLAVGTADGSGDLTTTEQDIIAKTDFDTEAGANTLHDWHAQTDTLAGLLDGTTTPANLRVNLYIPDANDKGTNIIAMTGTLTVVWVNCGDY